MQLRRMMPRKRTHKGKPAKAATVPAEELRVITFDPSEWLRYAKAILTAADRLTSREQDLKTWAYRAAATITEAVRHPKAVEGCREVGDGQIAITRSRDVWSRLQSLTVQTSGVVGSAVNHQIGQQESPAS